MKSGQNYNRLQEELGSKVREYFAYLANDISLSHREQHIQRDAHIFRGIAQIYRDGETMRYLNGVLADVREKRPVRGVESRQLPQKSTQTVQIPDFKSMDEIIGELSIAKPQFMYVVGRLGIDVVARTVEDRELEGVSEAAYDKIKKFVK